MKQDKYWLEVGDIWWFETIKKHCLILTKEDPPISHRSYVYLYRYLRLEDGRHEYIYHREVNAHGEGWFRYIA